MIGVAYVELMKKSVLNVEWITCEDVENTVDLIFRERNLYVVSVCSSKYEFADIAG